MHGQRIDRPDMNLVLGSDPEDDPARPEDADVAKAIVLAEVVRIVEKGDAVMSKLESGAIELRLATGEIFHLAEEAVTRTA